MYSDIPDPIHYVAENRASRVVMQRHEARVAELGPRPINTVRGGPPQGPGGTALSEWCAQRDAVRGDTDAELKRIAWTEAWWQVR